MTRRKSPQFNCSLHAKIKHTEFEDKFLTKTHANVNRVLKEFSNKQGKKGTEH